MENPETYGKVFYKMDSNGGSGILCFICISNIFIEGNISLYRTYCPCVCGLQPELDVVVSVNEPLMDSPQVSTGNLMTITMESLYSPPESWTLAGAQYCYAAALPIPVTADVSIHGRHQGASYVQQLHSSTSPWDICKAK